MQDRRQRPLTPVVTIPEPPQLREWGLNNGFDLGDRGRIPSEVEAAYAEAQVKV